MTSGKEIQVHNPGFILSWRRTWQRHPPNEEFALLWKRDLTHGVGGRLPYKPMISFIRDRLDFPTATYNTIIMYYIHQKLQKKAPERLKNLERLQILIYSATIPAGAAADRLGASTCIPIRSPFRECRLSSPSDDV
ncbi:MAG: hypothetical protein JO223_17205 [Hyphomicrobiales bacterium]|nr:hypothetical protein [Hyphomicrobiales bacterium]